MRLQHRPAYLFHKAFYKTLVSLSVWRNNRAAAEAFRDPALLDDVLHNRGTAARRSAVWIAILFVISAVAFHLYRAGVDHPSVPRLETLKADLAKLDLSKAGPFKADPSKSNLSAPEAPKANPPASASLPSVTPLLRSGPAKPAEYRFPRDGYCLIACKRDRTLYAYRRAEGKESHWTKTAAFPMAIGRKSGDKGEAGDLRTPEGRFWIIGMQYGPVKGAAYGALIFNLNYPRPGDAAEGKTGQGIWIHGVEMGKLPSFTHGCLSLSNEDMFALASYADIGTPVVILSDSLAPDPDGQIDAEGMEHEYPGIMQSYARKTHADTLARADVLKKAGKFVDQETKAYPELSMQALSGADKQAILDRLEQWRRDWSARAIDAYGAHYDPQFRDRQGRDREAFLARKKNIFASKTKIEMEIKDPKVESEGYARAKVTFRQDYLAESPQGDQRSSELKSLHLEEGPSGWLIITE